MFVVMKYEYLGITKLHKYVRKYILELPRMPYLVCTPRSLKKEKNK